MQSLPVDSILPKLRELVANHPTVVVQAPPGSGKTTRVAPYLVETGFCDERNRTFLLQPRRVAARATAQRIATERDWKMGQRIGYQVRFEKRTSKETSLVVATEGILLRHISDDSILTDVRAVILDEFHERSLNADLILGMVRRIQSLVRNDLRLVIMSATLDAERLAKQLDAPVIATTGTLHPVDIKYRPAKPRQPLVDHVTETTLLTLNKSEGDVLVFLPGVGEISRVERELSRRPQTRNCELLQLHGSLPLEQQNRALQSKGKRRVVLSTNVAETSLTIDGIRTVIDSGLARVLRFDPGVGLNRLQLEPICQSSAEQRSGRAGRLEAGQCIRLWDQKSQRARPSHLEPEIQRVDLASTVLQLLEWGEDPMGDFPWLESPRREAMETAIALLQRLGAVSDGTITKLGLRMARLPISPRLARMLVEAEKYDAVDIVALVAAMLSERDPFLRNRDDGPTTKKIQRWSCDVTQRYLSLDEYFTTGKERTALGEIHRGAATSIKRVAEQLARNARAAESGVSRDEAISVDVVISKCLLAAFPDRLARRRKTGGDKAKMVGGRGVKMANSSGVQDAEFFLCIDVDNRPTDAIVRQASGIDVAWLSDDLLEEREELFFNPTRKQVEARQRTYFADLLLDESTSSVTDETRCAKLLLAEAAKDVSKICPDKKSDFAFFLTRLNCLREWSPELELPSGDDATLLEVAAELCPGRRSFDELRKAPWLDWLKARLTPKQQAAMERECPERLTVPSGSRIRLQYELGKPPILAVRIQEVFSWTETPRIAFGRVPVLLHLLAPNMRPQQVTDDLASFWANTYEVVRKELRRRYPKHAWPEDPLTAKPVKKG